MHAPGKKGKKKAADATTDAAEHAEEAGLEEEDVDLRTSEAAILKFLQLGTAKKSD